MSKKNKCPSCDKEMDCGWEDRPMTEGEAEIAADLDKFFEENDWEAEFRKKFASNIREGDIFGWSHQDMGGFEMVKDFIKELVKEKREEGYRAASIEWQDRMKNTMDIVEMIRDNLRKL